MGYIMKKRKINGNGMKKTTLLVAILMVLVLFGSGCEEKPSDAEKKIIEVEEKPGEVSLEMEKTSFNQDETIKAWIKSEKKLFTGFPAFAVYQLVDGEWQWLDIYDIFCALPCSADEAEICSGPIACAPLPEHCQDFNPALDNFEWDQTVLQTRTIECSLDVLSTCSYKESVKPGTYKVVFWYSDNCINEELFDSEENNVQKVEREFEIV